MLSSAGVRLPPRPAEVPGLADLITALEAEIPDLKFQRETIAQGRVDFAALAELYLPGTRVYCQAPQPTPF